LVASSTDLDVKKNAYEGISTVIHNIPLLIQPEFSKLQELADRDTEVRKEFIEEVDLGPFKQKYDHGIPVRRAAYQLLETMYDRAKDYVNIVRIVDTVNNKGLIDTSEECVVMNLNLLVKLSQFSSIVVISRIEQIVGALEPLHSRNIKSVTKSERAMNIVRAGLRVVHALFSSQELQDNPNGRFNDFVSMQILQNPDAKAIYEKILQSSSEIGGQNQVNY